MGNVMVQALTHGRVTSLEEIRTIVRSSVELTRYEPGDDAGRWKDLNERFSELLNKAAVSGGGEGG